MHPQVTRGPGPFPHDLQQDRLISRHVRSHDGRSDACRHRTTHDEQSEKQAWDGVSDPDGEDARKTASAARATVRTFFMTGL